MRLELRGGGAVTVTREAKPNHRYLNLRVTARAGGSVLLLILTDPEALELARMLIASGEPAAIDVTEARAVRR